MPVHNKITSDTAAQFPARPVDFEWRVKVLQVARTSYRSLNADIKHAGWALSFVASGNVVTSTMGHSFEVPEGSVMVHPPNLAYSEYAEGAGTHEWMVFDAIDPQNVDIFAANPVAPVVHLGDAATPFRETFECLLSAWTDRGCDENLRSEMVYRHAIRLLGVVIDRWRACGQPPRPADMAGPDRRFTELIAHMSENSMLPLSRTDLSAHANMHPNSLDRAFRQAYGIPPMQMLRNIRLRRVQRLLETTDMPLDQIASTTGFQDASYLARAFRSAFHLSPGRYRQNVRALARPY